MDDRDGQRRLIGGQIYSVDYDFLDVYGFELVAGRGFSRAFSDEARGAILLNETALEAYGFGAPEEALGQRGSLWEQDVEVIGVVKDFHQYALHRPVAPLILRLHDTVLTQLSFHLDTEDVRKTVAELEALWNRLVPTRPFTYGFLDEIYDAQYRTEKQFGRLFVVFATLVIGIAALGLFGLTSFTTLQRTKEIGVRKVLGASVPAIVVLLSRDLVGLVLVAFILAIPTIYVIMNSWLDTFAYRIDITWGIFLMAGLTALVIALATVSYQSIRAASANPIDALRYE